MATSGGHPAASQYWATGFNAEQDTHKWSPIQHARCRGLTTPPLAFWLGVGVIMSTGNIEESQEQCLEIIHKGVSPGLLVELLSFLDDEEDAFGDVDSED